MINWGAAVDNLHGVLSLIVGLWVGFGPKFAWQKGR
jgi:hypothetical protein